MAVLNNQRVHIYAVPSIQWIKNWLPNPTISKTKSNIRKAIKIRLPELGFGQPTFKIKWPKKRTTSHRGWPCAGSNHFIKKQPLVVHGTTECVHRKKISGHRGDSNFSWAIRPTICSSIHCHQPTRAHDVCRKGLGKNMSLVRTDLMATHRYPATKTNTCNHLQMLQVAAISFKYHKYQHFWA